MKTVDSKAPCSKRHLGLIAAYLFTNRYGLYAVLLRCFSTVVESPGSFDVLLNCTTCIDASRCDHAMGFGSIKP